MPCHCHGWVAVLHTLLSWCCTTRHNTKGYCCFLCWFRCISFWYFFYFFFLYPLWFFQIFYFVSMKLAFTFFTINSYIVTLQICAGCLTIFFVYVEFWKQAQKMPTVSTNQVFILRLLLTAITTELRTFASHPHDISYCCYAWWLQSFWPLCFWRICPNPMSAYKESLKVKRSVACSPSAQQTCTKCMNQSRP